MRLNKALSIIATCFIGSAFSGEILFVNMNNSKDEIAIAQKAAKENGDTIIVIPTPGKIYDHNEFKKLVHEKAFKSLIISGHSGGDVFQGGELASDENGNPTDKLENRVKIEDMLSALDDSKSVNLESLYLMGCYTANKSKISFWKNALPNLKFIAGFDQEAPLSTQPAAQKYLYNLMKKEEAITSASSAQNLKLLLNGIDILKIVNTSLYIRCQEEDYNYISQTSAAKKLNKIDASACAELVGDFRKNHVAVVRQYMSGELEPTTLSTKDSPLRKAYSAARKAEYCYDIATDNLLPELDADSLFLLLFNKGFNETLSQYYKQDIEDSIRDLEQFGDPDKRKFVNTQVGLQFKMIHDIESLLKRPEFESLVNSEFKQMKEQRLDILKKNPNIERCVSENRDCNYTPSLIRKYLALRGMEWKFKRDNETQGEYFRKQLSGRIESLPKIMSETALTSEHMAVMKKMISNPETVTRRDILTLKKGLKESPQGTPAIERLRLAINRATDLSTDFPFSWHEYTGGEIETPSSRNEKLKNPDLKIINDLFLEEYYLREERI